MGSGLYNCVHKQDLPEGLKYKGISDLKHKSTLTLLVAIALCAVGNGGAFAFSFGRLFPASRSGIRGALIRGSGGQKTPSNVLKEAVKEASSAQKVTTKTTTMKPPVVSVTKKPSLLSFLQKPLVTAAPQKLSQPVTNSPIFYIRLPPNPYVYVPGLGYVSPNSNSYNFIRPDVDFVNNGKPSSIYHFKPSSTTTIPPTTTTTTTTTTTPAPTTTPAKTVRPLPTKKPSPITWLSGPWFFNGRPSNMFIFNSPHNPGHFDKLHQTYSKPGVYTQ
ncbi:serine proteinase stubble-like [Penaeus chinensis]|uniref:serine proteinase stubble-like n=1 Tax=Penaeus chinensis TaxID=139456 RepID=UPI001FB80627|nr:serine proteinase stubble-like [Penaeus chinensis]